MATCIFPAHLMGPLTKISVTRGVTRRLHNRRISMVVTPEGAYQLHIAKALEPGEAAELRAHGHRDSLEDYILRDRVWYSLVTLPAKAFGAVFWYYEKLKGRQQRKKS